MELKPQTECAPVHRLTAPIWQDVLAQAMTGELVAAMNYASLAEICDDPEEAAEALEHAAIERGHAAAFAAEGRKIGVDVVNNVDAKHWKRLREAFMRCVAERDFIGCLIVQEIMLESFAAGELLPRGERGAGESRQDLRRHRGGGSRSTSITPWRFSKRSAPRTRSASTTRCTGCIWR